MWHRLTGGFPPEPKADMECVPGHATPETLIRSLFRTLGAADVERSHVTSQRTDAEGDRVAEGLVGTEDARYRWTEIVPRSSAYAISRQYETYGLPGIGLRWSFSLDQAGQLGRVVFRHRDLAVEWEHEASRTLFVEDWHEVLGTTRV